jgi:DNA-binding response OmpR family regulator
MADVTLLASNFAQLSKLKILIVDDEPSNVFLLEELLQDAGYTRVTSLTDSSNAIETCLTLRPDLLLLDLMMPPPDGYAVLEAVRAAQHEVFMPVIVLTADVSDKARRRALAAGATDFLLKPFDPTEVLLRIRNLLEMRRLQVHLDTQRAAFEDAVYARASEVRELQSLLNKAQTRPNE